MRVRLLVSIAVPVLVFGVTLSILLGRQHNAEATADPPVTGSPMTGAAGSASAMPPTIAQAADSRSSTAQSTPIPAVTTDPASGAAPAATDSRADPELPVKLLVRPAQGDSAQVASLLNMSADTLSVRVTVVNRHTHLRSVVDIALMQHERKNLLATGLSLSSGDEVTIESPSFQKFVSQVP